MKNLKLQRRSAMPDEVSLRESNAWTQAILDNIGEGIITTDELGTISSFNLAAERIFGYAPGEVIGQNVKILMAGPHNGEHDCYICPHLLSGRSQIFGSGRELEGLRRDGSSFPMELAITEVQFESRRLFTGLVRDISERIRTEDRLLEAARLSSIGELVAGVAHEINNPLTSILGFAHLLLNADPPESIKADLQIVYSEAQRAASIVQNLLIFARRSGPHQVRSNVNSILTKALQLKTYDFMTDGLEVSQRLAPDIPVTMLDEHQMVQVVVNILTNAQQAIKSASKTGSISICSSRLGGKIRVSICDNGPGIRPDLLRRIFEPFFTTKDVGAGTGLGLSICYGIVQQQGGEIWAESTEGRGTTFHIELPLTSPDGREVSQHLPVHPPSVTASKHILVVDDETNVRSFLRRVLEFERYTVDVAKDGQEAWAKLHAGPYDCILLDLKMPGTNGRELYQRILGWDKTLARKLLFFTGDTARLEFRDFIASTGNPLLIKPIRVEELLAQVGKLLEQTVDCNRPADAINGR